MISAIILCIYFYRIGETNFGLAFSILAAIRLGVGAAEVMEKYR